MGSGTDARKYMQSMGNNWVKVHIDKHNYYPDM